MATYTTGETAHAFYVAESAYGTTPTGALSYMGLPKSIKIKGNTNPEKHKVPASRGFSTHTRGPYDYGCTYTGKAQVVSGGYSWVNFFAKYAYGATTGIQDGTTSYGRLDSFSMLLRTTQGAANKYRLLNGCKIDSLKISSDGPGKPLMFEAEILAQMLDYSTTKAFTVFQSVTVGADPTLITTAPLTNICTLTYNIGGGAVNLSPIKSWSLTVNNHLEREYGSKTGADSACYPVTCALNETDRDIIFEATIPWSSEAFVNARIADTAITALTIPIGANTVTLSGGIFATDDFPEMAEGSMEETVKMEFNGLTIA